MLKPFEFDKNDVNIQHKYLNQYIVTVKHNYWADPECEDFKSRCKHHYILEQDYHCCYCRQQIIVSNGRQWDLDHIVPKSIHPQFLFEPKNLAISCIDCNTSKKNKETLVNPRRKTYPKFGKDFRISHPHFDVYEENILFIPGKIYVGVNDKGNETIRTCDLLRFSLQYLGWIKTISKDDLISRKFSEYLAAKDEASKKLALLEIQIILKIYN